MSEAENTSKGKFEPKVKVELNPPRDDIISLSELAAADGAPGNKAWVAIKGKVYDVTGNKMYQPGNSYNAFVGKDASRALGKTSTKAEDVDSKWDDLTDEQKQTLQDWVTFFSKRYNIVGTVEGATNF